MAHKSFGEHFRYPKLNKYEGLEGNIPLRYADIFMGIEVETENTLHRCINIPGSFAAIDDGSLKLDGKEFVTVPVKLGYLEKELERLFGAIPQASFSCRTSIHVHMNARDFTVQNMLDFTMIYTLFERNLYRYSGDRWTNNFCIPLRTAPNYLQTLMSNIGDNTVERDDHLLSNDIMWSKYLGYNLSPLTGSGGQSKRYGTIEFRQMIGNNNIQYILDWCNLITCMKFYAKSVNSDELLALIKANKGHTIAEDIFRQWTPLVMGTTGTQDVKESNSFLKFCLNAKPTSGAGSLRAVLAESQARQARNIEFPLNFITHERALATHFRNTSAHSVIMDDVEVGISRLSTTASAADIWSVYSGATPPPAFEPIPRTAAAARERIAAAERLRTTSVVAPSIQDSTT